MLYEAVNPGALRSWCGPTVIAAITGLAIPSVKARIKKVRGHNGPVKGTHTWEVRKVLEELGYQMEHQPLYRNGALRAGGLKLTLAQWLKRPRDMEAAYILEVTNHWVAVKGRWFCDTYTKGVPVRCTQAPRKRKRVCNVYKVTPVRR